MASPRIRASSASSTGPRVWSPSRWISSTMTQPTSSSASRSDEVRQMASNFSVVATHRSASRTRLTSTLYSPESRSTRRPCPRHPWSSWSSSSVRDRCGTSQAALRPCPRMARRAAAMPMTVLPDPVGATTIRWPSWSTTCGTASAWAGLNVGKGRNRAHSGGVSSATGTVAPAAGPVSAWACQSRSKASRAASADRPSVRTSRAGPTRPRSHSALITVSRSRPRASWYSAIVSCSRR